MITLPIGFTALPPAKPSVARFSYGHQSVSPKRPVSFGGFPLVSTQSKRKGLDWFLESLTNAIRYVFRRSKPESTADHELGHLILSDLLGYPAKSITAVPNRQKGNLGGVLPDYGRVRQQLKQAMESGSSEQARKISLSEIIHCRAGEVFQRQYHPNFFAFMGASGDRERIQDWLKTFTTFAPAYKTAAKKKALLTDLDDAIRQVFYLIPYEHFRFLRSELLRRKTITGQQACQTFLRERLGKHINWQGMKRLLEETLTKYAKGV